MSCRVCEFLVTLSDEELLKATPCIGRVVEARWPGATYTLDGNATSDEIAAAYATTLNAIPKYLHKFLSNRMQ